MRVLFERIICATDFSDLSNRAVPYAVSLAREFGARLYFCHVIGLPSAAIYGEVLWDPTEQQEKAERFAHKQLGRLIAPQQIEWEALIASGPTADEITRLAQETGADLVVAATHGRSGLRRFLLGSVTERLMRMLPCPLLIIPDPVTDVPEDMLRPLRFSRILIGCDFSVDAAAALEHGISLAQEFQAELYLAHVIEPSAYAGKVVAPQEPAEGFQPVLKDFLEEKLTAQIPADAGNWCSPVPVLLEGQPDEALIQFAVSHGIDLIVLGVRGQNVVEKLFIGSTTDRVIRKAPCPVLSVCTSAKE